MQVFYNKQGKLIDKFGNLVQKVKCTKCGKEIYKAKCDINQARKFNAKIFCNKSCAISFFHKGRAKTQEQREQICRTLTGRKLGEYSKERRENVREGLKRHYDRIGRKHNPDIYQTVEWDKIRKKVFKRDNWTCQICGVKCVNKTDKKNKKKWIQCHHIIPYRICRCHNEADLITLCQSCHSREERKYHNLLRQGKRRI